MWFMGRRVFFVLALAGIAACVAPSGDDASEASESDLTWKVDKVDTTLPDVDAIGYEVDLRIDDTRGAEKLAADVKGTFVATRDLDELTLDFSGNTIDSVQVNGHPSTFRRDGDVLAIATPGVTKGKKLTTRIRYHGDVAHADGQDANDLNAFGGFMLRETNAEEKRIYTTMSWPHTARRWLPLRDHPRDGAMLAVTATFPSSFTVLANGKRSATNANADGTTTWRYEQLFPMPTYDFHVSAYEGWQVDTQTSQSGIPMAIYTYPRDAANVQAVYSDVHAAMDWYETHLGKYRWGSAAWIEEPIFGGGMENASVISMDETVFADLKDARDIAFHELAHHWSGNLVRARTWNDFWLSEGFTEYEKGRFVADHDGPDAGRDVWLGYRRRALAADNGHAVRPPDPEVDVLTIFDDVSYQKGAMCLHALERIVGKDAMLDFLKGWFDRHAGEAMTTADLERELGDASGKKDEVSQLFASFVYRKGHPDVRVALSGTTLTVTQAQRGDPFVFTLDVDAVDAAGKKTRVIANVTDRTASVEVPPGTTSFVVDPDVYFIGTFR